MDVSYYHSSLSPMATTDLVFWWEQTETQHSRWPGRSSYQTLMWAHPQCHWWWPLPGWTLPAGHRLACWVPRWNFRCSQIHHHHWWRWCRTLCPLVHQTAPVTKEAKGVKLCINSASPGQSRDFECPTWAGKELQGVFEFLHPRLLLSCLHRSDISPCSWRAGRLIYGVRTWRAKH